MIIMFHSITFSARAAQALTNNQEINNLAELALLSDEEVDSLVKLVRRPGGQVANPDVVFAGQPGEINNPGSLVSMRTMTSLMLVFFIRHMDMISKSTVISIHLSDKGSD